MSPVLLTASLSDRSVARILYVLRKKAATGVIRIIDDKDQHWTLYLRDGFPVDADLPNANETLGRILFELGIITSEAYNGSLTELSKGGGLHGEILRRMGALDEAGLQKGLVAQLKRKFARAMAIGEGSLSVVLEPHERGARPDSPRVDPRFVIHHGVRNGYSMERLARDLAVLEGKGAKLAAGAEDLAQYGFLADDHAILGDARVGVLHAGAAEGSGGAPGGVGADDPLHAARDRGARRATAGRSAGHRSAQEGDHDAAPARRQGGASAGGEVEPRPPRPCASGSWPRPRSRPARTTSRSSEIGREAASDDVRKAYFALAKVFHPDRVLAQGLEAILPEAALVFSRINDAYAVLSDAGKRFEYLKELQGGISSAARAADDDKAQRILSAEFAFEKAEVLLKRRDFAAARDEAERALELNAEEGAYRALAAWARYSAAPEDARQAMLPKLKHELAQATSKEPKYANGHFWLAQVHKLSGDDEAAHREFKETFRLDPRNLDAEREVRLFNMRKQKDGDKKGILDKLRKR